MAAALGYAELPNGVRMPRLGFGTAGLGCAKSYKAVRDALEAGYRHIDTAQAAEWCVHFLPFSAPPRARRTAMHTAELSAERETPVGEARHFDHRRRSRDSVEAEGDMLHPHADLVRSGLKVDLVCSDREMDDTRLMHD